MSLWIKMLFFSSFWRFWLTHKVGKTDNAVACFLMHNTNGHSKKILCHFIHCRLRQYQNCICAYLHVLHYWYVEWFSENHISPSNNAIPMTLHQIAVLYRSRIWKNYMVRTFLDAEIWLWDNRVAYCKIWKHLILWILLVCTESYLGIYQRSDAVTFPGSTQK